MMSLLSFPEPLFTLGGDKIETVAPSSYAGHACQGQVRRPNGLRVTVRWYADGRTQLLAVRQAGLDDYDTLDDDVSPETLNRLREALTPHGDAA